jgi:hypothetical protein
VDAQRRRAWLTVPEIEKELGVSLETAMQFGLRLRIQAGRGGKPCKRRDITEWRDAIKSLAKRLK